MTWWCRWLADEVCELVQCHDRAVCLDLWKRTLVAPQAPVDRMREYLCVSPPPPAV